MNLMQIHLVDSHLHLQDPRLTADLNGVLSRAKNAGVFRLICNGTNQTDWPMVADFARRYENIVPCFGLHPWYVATRTQDWQLQLQDALTAMPSGVGEVGLDRWIENRDEKDQETVFRDQLTIAHRLKRPVMIHCLHAWDWLMKVLRSEPPLPAGILLHAYGGPAELVDPLADLGAYFSFAGNVLEEKRTRVRQALRRVPADRHLVETDSPDLLPPDAFRHIDFQKRGNNIPNEPANLPAVVHGIAALRNMPDDRLTEILWTNCRKFFGDLIDAKDSADYDKKS